MKDHLIAVSVVLALGGCAFSGVDRPPIEKNVAQNVINEFPRSMSKDEAMDIARSALQSSGFELASFTPELAEVRTKARQVPIPAACDCGTWNGAVVQGTAMATYLITVDTPPGDKTLVKANFTCGTTFTGRNLYGATTKVETYQCASTGQMEQQFWEKFRQIYDVRRRK